MIILGINDSHDASACLVENGKLLVAIGEERIQRIKGVAGFPIGAIQECLRYAKLKKEDIDIVAFGSKNLSPDNLWNMGATLSIEDHLKLQNEYYIPRILEGKDIKLNDVLKNYKPVSNLSYPYKKIPFASNDEVDTRHLLNLINNIRVEHTEYFFKIKPKNIKFYDHHSCHARYAYYHSNMSDKDEVVVVTADAGGDGCYSTVHTVTNGVFNEIHRARNNIIGKIYSSITLLLGMKPNEHEFKVMGLAPYASEYQKKRPREVFDKSLTVDGLDFIRDPEMKDYFQYFKCRLEGCRFDGIAGGLQDFVEDRMSTWFNNISIETNINKFCYAGGVSNNIKANKSISEKYFIDDFFVPAGPSDENLSIGAAYMAYEQEQEQNMKHIANNITQYDAYFGCDIESEDIKNFKKNKYVKDNYRHKECSIEFSEIAEILSKGEIIAVCSGRMEFGSRALGHRSLIADPSNPSTLKNINELIKKRDFWMPFTPSIIDHQYDNYVINNKDLHTSFMTMSFDTTKKGGEHLISAIHPYDQTVRPQKVTRDTSPEYYKIINALYDLTGVGAVLNTSLNIHGKPIVMKPVDIVNEILLEGVPLNYILVNNILFTRI